LNKDNAISVHKTLAELYKAIVNADQSGVDWLKVLEQLPAVEAVINAERLREYRRAMQLILQAA